MLQFSGLYHVSVVHKMLFVYLFCFFFGGGAFCRDFDLKIIVAFKGTVICHEVYLRISQQVKKSCLANMMVFYASQN